MAEKKKTDKVRKAPLNLFLDDQLRAALEAARTKAEAALGVTVSMTQVAKGAIKKGLGLTK